MPDENKFTLVKPVSPDPHQMALDLAELMVKRPITPVRGNIFNSFLFEVIKIIFFTSLSEKSNAAHYRIICYR